MLRAVIAGFFAPAALAAAALLVPPHGAEAGEPLASNESLAGKLLVATPDMPDPRFAETVVYMVEHNASGAMGLVINQPLGEVPVADLLAGLNMKTERLKGKIELHYGGPVENNRAFVLHSPDYVADETVVVKEKLAVTGEREIVRDIAEGNGPEQSIVVFGYAGWAPGQLEREIKAGGWVAVPADKGFVFDDDEAHHKWKRAIARRTIGI